MNARNSLITLCTVALLAVGAVVTWLVLQTSSAGARSGGASSAPLSALKEKAGTGTSDDSIAAAGHELDEAKQKYIWDAEHVTFEIETYAGKRLRTALKERDRDGVFQAFRKGFSGQQLDVEAFEEVTRYTANEKTWKTRLTDKTLNAEQFADYILSRFDAFDSIEKTGMRVLKIDALDGDHKGGVWEIRTLITGLGTAADGDKLYFSQHGRATVSFKSDEEIRTQAIITNWEIDDESLVTSPVLMREATTEYGLDKLALRDNWLQEGETGWQYAHHVAVDDFDQDSLPDIAVSSKNGTLHLLRTMPEGGTQDVTDLVRLPRDFLVAKRQTAVTWIDIDNDGFPELLVGPTLFKNIKGERFEWIRDTGLSFKQNPMGTAVADYDSDGLLDLYMLFQGIAEVDSDSGQNPGWINDDESGEENQLWRNLGNGKFEDVTAKTGAGGGLRMSFAGVWFHANEDRYPDLYVANDFGTNSLLINSEGGTFTDVSKESKTADFATSMGVAAGDINGDGRTDIYVANMYSKMGRRIVDQICEADYAPGIYEHLQGACSGNRLYTNQGDGKPFEEISQKLHINGVGWAYSPAFADFDRDGFLDIYATAGFMSYRRDKPDG